MSEQDKINRSLQNNQNSEGNSQQGVITSYHEESSGPLPPPGILKKYDEIVPGAAQRILKMAEDQTKHRQSLEAKVINSGVVNSRLGLVFGFIIGISTIVGGVYLAFIGKEGVGTLISFSGLASLVGVFVYGSTERKKEKFKKTKSNKILIR